LAVARQIKTLNPEVEILFVGANGKMEMQKVPEAGFNIVGLDIVGIQRRLTWKNLLVPFKLISSLLKARAIIKSFKPEIVIGFGGYASGPLLRVAGLMGIPTVLQEQNSYAGLTNKLLSKKAERICVAYEGMEKYFPQDKIVITGNPVRKDIIHLNGSSKDGFEFFQLERGVPTILVLGGSLGARTINNSIVSGFAQIRRANVQVLWQTGKFYFKEMTEKLVQSKLSNIRAVEFIRHMDKAYRVADVIISRAGALSISELELVGKPVIFVPSPNVAEDHQTKNAEALVSKNAALMVPDSTAEKELISIALDLIRNQEKCEQLALNIKRESRPNATEDIVNQVMEVLK
jgi:UDP-N-acetylglucosamine--N-acetylmuramyl-(pentapeptide) pyrophosphoryl-undecaprenol N-acetylglucosamine transferase